MKFAQPLFVLLLAARAIFAADAPPASLLPPDAKVVLGIQLQKLIESPMLQNAISQAQTANNATWMKTISTLGFDPLKDLDEVWLATTADGQNPPALVLAKGRFNLARLTLAAKPYHDVPVFEFEQGAGGMIAFLDASTVVAGDKSMVQAALERRASTAAPSALVQRIAGLRERYDIWGLGEQEGGLAPVAGTEGKGLESIDRFQFGLALHNDLELGAEIHAKSEEDVQKLGMMLGLLNMMVKSQNPSSGVRFDVAAEQGTFKVSVKVPEAELKKGLEQQNGAFSQLFTSAAAKPAPRISAVAAPPESPVPASAPAPAAKAPAKPAQQVTDKDGNTVILTLPGAKR